MLVPFGNRMTMLSIIVPVYNVEKYLDECLISIERQTSKNFEVIIVNDGSTDNCQTIIEKYCSKNKNWSSYQKENGGLMSAYLFGIEKSKGDYIGFIDSDDYIDEKFVELMYDNNLEKADIVICDRYNIINGNILSNKEDPLFSGFYAQNNKEIYKKILPPFSGRHISNARWNKIFRREIVLDNIKYCESKSRIMEDRFFTPSCMFDAKSFKFIDDKLYFYRHREGSNHSMSSPHLYDAIKLLIRTQKQMLLDKGLLDDYISEFEEACLDYVSLFVQRNILKNNKFKQRMLFSKQIVSDKAICLIVANNKKKLKRRLGFAIRILVFTRSALLFVLFTYFA